MIIVRAPFRVSFLGGGTDLPWFFERFSGAVISTAIDKHMFISAHPMFDSNSTLLKYSKTELVSNVGQLKHPIAREILVSRNVNGQDISVSADIPAGSGLGSSSAFAVALGHLTAEINGQEIQKAELAEYACDVEINRLGEPIGKQDQYASSFGGFNSYRFFPGGQVQVKPFELKSESREWLEGSLVLVKIGDRSRSASELLLQQKVDSLKNKTRFTALENLAQVTIQAVESINKDIESLPSFVNEGWRLKKESSISASSQKIDELIDYGFSKGALGAKMLGAGRTGFVLFFVQPERRDVFISHFSKNKTLLIKPDYLGSTIIYQDK